MTEHNKIIELTDVSMRWDSIKVLNDINLTVNRGDFIAITGPNGGGKTTLLKIILKLLKPSSGSVKYYDEDGELTSRLAIGYLPQKNMVDSHFPIDVRRVIESGLIAMNWMSKDEKSERVKRMLETVGLSGHATHTIGELSGGQLQRALLGRALISEPKVVVLDEPLSYIDKRFERQIYDIIAQIQPHCSILLVSHEITTIAEMANRHLIVDHEIHECSASHHFARLACDEQD